MTHWRIVYGLTGAWLALLVVAGCVSNRALNGAAHSVSNAAYAVEWTAYDLDKAVWAAVDTATNRFSAYVDQQMTHSAENHKYYTKILVGIAAIITGLVGFFAENIKRRVKRWTK